MAWEPVDSQTEFLVNAAGDYLIDDTGDFLVLSEGDTEWAPVPGAAGAVWAPVTSAPASWTPVTT